MALVNLPTANFVLLQILACFFVQYVACHLKNLGEVVVSRNRINQSSLKIIGGTKTDQLEFPFNAIFINYGGMCGGTILARKVVLTAGHCFDFNKNISQMKIMSSR